MIFTQEEIERIQKVLEQCGKWLLKKRNVVGVGIGRKIVGSRQAQELALVVSVTMKLPEHKLNKKDIIPKVLRGVKTDVQEVGIIYATGKTPTAKRSDSWRPAPGGVSIGHPEITAGTLGCLVKRGEEVFILSNNHVLANSNDAQKGDAILQPGPYDGGTLEKDKIATLESFVPISIGGNSDSYLVRGMALSLNLLARLLNKKSRFAVAEYSINKVDAAIAKPLKKNNVTPKILKVGIPSGVAKATPGMPIKKSGRTTGLTTGYVKVINAIIGIQYGDKVALFAGQIIATRMAKEGDSGSAVLDKKNNIVGLLCATSEQVTIINPIEAIRETLRVEIVTAAK